MDSAEVEERSEIARAEFQDLRLFDAPRRPAREARGMRRAV